MTEDEAKKNWCPFVRAVTGDITSDGTSKHRNDQPSYNRVVSGAQWAVPQGGCCVGSACMAWRWDSPLPRPNYILVRPGSEEISDEKWELVAEPSCETVGDQVMERLRLKPDASVYKQRPLPRDGHCGLAGRP